jgi:hypothetical protein
LLVDASLGAESVALLVVLSVVKKRPVVVVVAAAFVAAVVLEAKGEGIDKDRADAVRLVKVLEKDVAATTDADARRAC